MREQASRDHQEIQGVAFRGCEMWLRATWPTVIVWRWIAKEAAVVDSCFGWFLLPGELGYVGRF